MSDDSEQTKVVKEILKWIKISAIKDAKLVLEEQFQEDSKKRIYQLSDGKKGTREIAKVVIVSHGTVFNYWKSWEKIGLGESITVDGRSRFKRSFDLNDFGIKISEVKTKDQSKTLQEEEQENDD